MSDKTEDAREEVRWFATAMEKALKENDHKPGWHNSRIAYLIRRLDQEVLELKEAAGLTCSQCGAFVKKGSSYRPDNRSRILHECVDVANFAMMIADNFGRAR